jgi:hypothetical protein
MCYLFHPIPRPLPQQGEIIPPFLRRDLGWGQDINPFKYDDLFYLIWMSIHVTLSGFIVRFYDFIYNNDSPTGLIKFGRYDIGYSLQKSISLTAIIPVMGLVSNQP